MKINFSKRDLEVCLHASNYFDEAPEQFDLPDYKGDYEQWQKTKEKLWKAIKQMENNNES